MRTLGYFLPMICWWVSGRPGLLYLWWLSSLGSVCIRSWVAVETSAGPSYNACKVQGMGDVLPPDGGNNKNSVLVRVTIGVKKHHEQKQSWERVYLPHSPIEQFIIKSREDRNSSKTGTQRQELEHHRVVVLFGLLTMALLSLLSCRTQEHPRVAPPRMD